MPRLQRLAFLTLLCALVVLASIPLFVLPRVAEGGELRSAPVDAVVVLGGSPERLPAAIDLLPSLPEPPPQLHLTVPYDPPLLACGAVPGLPRVEATCFTPEEFTTSGEALYVGQQAAERGWERVVVVTSDFHVTRSRALVDRCVEALSPGTEVLWVASDTDNASLHGAWAIATEWPSLLATPWDHQPACARVED